MIAIGNSGERGLLAAAEAGLRAQSPLARAMAVWAVGRLASAEEIDDLARRFASQESEAAVVEEWNCLLAAPAGPGPAGRTDAGRERKVRGATLQCVVALLGFEPELLDLVFKLQLLALQFVELQIVG